MLKLHNTYSNTVEEFKPNSDSVKIYLCGPTVQSSPHIGHGRSAVVFDFLIRYLVYLDYEVNFVRNITDERANFYYNDQDDIPRITTNRPRNVGIRVSYKF